MASAQNQPPARRQPKEETHALRAVLELESVLLLGWVYWLTTADLPRQFDVDYRWEVFRRKITGGSLSMDSNHFGTNFIGHPLGGAGYYLSARSNGADPLGASAVAITGSLIWELFGEVREEVSFNDMITTPLAGISIGETTYQVARFFDRSERTWLHRGLGALLGPFTTLNDAIDRRHPVRVAQGYPTDVWHQVSGHLSWHQVHQSDRELHQEVAAGGEVRVENFIPPREALPLTFSWFDSGNVSRLRAEVALSGQGLSRVDISTHNVVGGLNYVASRNPGDAEFGFVGLGMDYTYTARSYERGGDAPLNRISMVRPLGVASGHHVRRGPWSVDAWFGGGPAFGGVDAVGLAPEQLVEDERVPNAARLHGYYLAWGYHADAQLQVGFRDLRAGGSMVTERYRSTRAPGGDPVTRIIDVSQQVDSYLGFRIPDTDTELRAYWVFRERSGTVERRHRDLREYSTGIQLRLFGR